MYDTRNNKTVTEPEQKDYSCWCSKKSGIYIYFFLVETSGFCHLFALFECYLNVGRVFEIFCVVVLHARNTGVHEIFRTFIGIVIFFSRLLHCNSQKVSPIYIIVSPRNRLPICTIGLQLPHL